MGLAKQTPTTAAARSSDDEVIRLEATLVNIPVLVSDRSGRYIPQLSRHDFNLYEDGVEQEIATFASEEVAFNVVLLLDMSPSVSGSVEAIQDACIAFVRQMRPQDRLMVISFDRRIRYLTGFTNDPRELEYAIRSTRTGSGTSVYDAVYDAVGRKLRDVEGRKALILFSDGEDTTSSYASHDDALEMVRESDVLVYGLRFPKEDYLLQMIDPTLRNRFPQIPIPIPWPVPRRGRGPITTTDPGTQPTPAPGTQRQRRGERGDFMADVATAGGGPVYDAQNVGDFSRLANQIAEELRHIYAISYYPTNKLSNGGYREVRVRVKGNDNLAVRHRRGYSAGSASKTNPSQ
jgi:VWFA-related protein